MDFSQPSLYVAIGSILFNPIFWNIAARAEYHQHVITRLAGGNPTYGCYLLALAIFTLGLVRDALFHAALLDQPLTPWLDSTVVKLVAGVLFTLGNVFVVTSMYALGVTGTYLGDYFGILMKERVTSFPFNVLDNPMYVGSTMVFVATSLWYASLAGLMVSAVVYVMYSIALRYEEPFTAMIYANANKNKE